MGHFRQRGQWAGLVSRRNETSVAVRHFVDIASQVARLMPCPPRLNWLTNATNDSIVQGADPITRDLLRVVFRPAC